MSGLPDIPVLHERIVVSDLPPTGRAFAIDADRGERETIAVAYGLVDVEALSAVGMVEPKGRTIRVTGRLTARVVQTCVVTLVPVVEDLDEEIALTFVEATEAERLERSMREEDSLEAPDVIEDGQIDLGAIVEEHMVLALNPYPRRPDAEIPESYRGDGPENESPFASLAGFGTGTGGKVGSED